MYAPLSLEKRVLLRAAELLRERGHCKGILWDDQGRMCALGALIVAATEYGGSAYDAADLVMWKRADISTGDDPKHDLVNWNNQHDRTGAEVIEAFEQAALT